MKFAAKMSDRRRQLATGIKCIPYFRRRHDAKLVYLLRGSRPLVGINGYLASDLAALYELPTGITAPVPTVWIPELGGGFDSTQIGTWCQERNLPMPNLSWQSVLGAANNFTNDPNSADGEVVLDIAVVAGAISVMFNNRPANINVVFAPNSLAGMVAAFQCVLANAKSGDSCSFSWGGPEDIATIAQLEPIFQQMSEKGISVTCASGDNGPDDGTSSPVTDYPGCSAYVCDCGATTILSDGSQVPWNSGGGASGGGFSRIVAKPLWQSFLPGSYRGEPDCVAMGDPANGWDTPFGPVGGTSAVAPFYAAVDAAINAQLMAAGKQPIGLLCPAMYQYEARAFTDIITGSITSNGNDPIMATTGWDAASGLGSIKAKTFYSLLTGATPVPTNTQPLPINLPPGLQQIIIDAINVEFAALEARNPVLRFVLPALNTIVDQVIGSVLAQYGGGSAARAIPPGLLGSIIGALLPVLFPGRGVCGLNPRPASKPNVDWGKIDWSGDINALVPIILNIIQALEATK